MPQVCLLGTGGMMPLKNRWLTSCYIEHEGKAVLIDCGEGTQITLAENQCKISRIDVLLITHCHADHVSGIPGFLLSLGNCSRTEPLDIYLPVGKTAVIKSLMSICERLPFEVKFHELSAREKTTFACEKIDSLLEISSLPLRHRVECLGYSLNFRKNPRFLPEKAQELNIPVKYWRTLHAGGQVTLEDGRIITQEQVTGDKRSALKITYVTDTLPIESIVDFARNSQLFICEGMYGDKDKKDSMNQKRHMLMQDACRLAKKAECEKLWLTHYSPAMLNPEDYTEELKGIFENVTVCKDGQKIEI